MNYKIKIQERFSTNEILLNQSKKNTKTIKELLLKNQLNFTEVILPNYYLDGLIVLGNSFELQISNNSEEISLIEKTKNINGEIKLNYIKSFSNIEKLDVFLVERNLRKKRKNLQLND